MTKTVYEHVTYVRTYELPDGLSQTAFIVYNGFTTNYGKIWGVNGNSGPNDTDYIELTISEMTFTPQNTSATFTVSNEGFSRTFPVWRTQTVDDNFVIPGGGGGGGGTNHVPIAINDSATTASNTPVNIQALLTTSDHPNDYDPDADPLTIISVGQPSHGAATIVTDAAGWNNRAVRYQPGNNFVGTDIFTYTIGDGRGGTATATITVQVNQGNRNPVANDDAVTTAPGKVVTINAVANDTDPDGDNLTITLLTQQPQHGTATINSDSKSITYTPTAGYTGADTVKYQISDGHNGTAVGSINLTVTLPTVGVIAESHQVTEGDLGIRNMQFSVQLTNAQLNHDPVTVHYRVEGLGASVVVGKDFTATEGDVTIPTGALIRDIQVPIIGDTERESNETIQLVLSNPQNARLPGNVSSQPYAGTIIDDDQPQDLPVDGGTDPSGHLLPNISEEWQEFAAELKETAEFALDEQVVELLYGGKLSPAAQKAKGWVKQGLDKLDHVEDLANAIGSVNKVIKDYNDHGDPARSVHVLAQDVVSWLGSGYVGVVGGAILTAGLSPIIGTVAAAGIGIIGAAYLASSAKTWWNHVMPPPPDFVDPDAATLDSIGGASLALTSAPNDPTANAVSVTYTGVLTAAVGDPAPDPYWQLDPTTGQITALKPLTSDVMAKLNESASRQGLLVDNPVGFTLQGDQDATDLNDVIIGGSGKDVINGGTGKDTLAGRQGDDVISGGTDADLMAGGAGNDAYFVDNIGDVVIEHTTEGADTVYALTHFRLPSNVETLVLQGGADLQAYGNELGNAIYGNSGNNTLDGDAGADSMYGGAGNDSYVVENGGDLVVENAGEGNDTVYASVHYTLTANVENLILRGSADLQGNGNGLANSLFGNSGNNTLDGGAGADSMYGGLGNDAYVVDNIGDVVVENAGEGSDTVYASANYRLSANVETLVLQGSAGLQGSGNALANALYGNSGNNTLDGDTGADSMYGGAGDDSYVVENGGDLVVENANEGSDTVYACLLYTSDAADE